MKLTPQNGPRDPLLQLRQDAEPWERTLGESGGGVDTPPLNPPKAFNELPPSKAAQYGRRQPCFESTVQTQEALYTVPPNLRGA